LASQLNHSHLNSAAGEERGRRADSSLLTHAAHDGDNAIVGGIDTTAAVVDEASLYRDRFVSADQTMGVDWLKHYSGNITEVPFP